MKQKPQILIVDDEQDLCEILQFNFMSVGYEVEVAHSAEEALALGVERFDLLLLDVMMPCMSGFELAERLRASDGLVSRVPIVFLTAKDSEEDKLTGFGVGADDYISKPFSVKEVLARVKAVLNRVGKVIEPQSQVAVYMGLTMNFEQKVVTVDGHIVAFTKTEFDLLGFLLTHRGRVYSRQQLLERVWPSDVVVTDRAVDVNLARIRKKLGCYASCIVARTGYGYSFET